MRFRQVHLDFHTSEHIPGIGVDFDKKQFQEALRAGHVDSITVFSKCHHGWSYHPTEANEMHPELDFDLLAAQIEAAHEIGVKAPIYISAGFDEKYAVRHPEDVIRELAGSVLILGVCLGHQAICAAFGANVTYARQLMHGKQSQVRREAGCPLLDDCPDIFPVARYHSLAVEESTLPACLRVTARTEDGEVMAVQHTERPIFGFQFHPESFMTPGGRNMLRAFMAVKG